MATDATTNVVVSLVTVQAVAVWLLQKAKAAAWIPFIQKNGGAINRVWALVAAGAGAVGVHAAWNGVQHTLIITGLDLATVGAALWHWLTNFVFQQLMYHGIAKNGAAPQLTLGSAMKGAINAELANMGGTPGGQK